MREIKFRAWDKGRKRFAPWIEICADGSFIRGEVEDSYSGLIPWEDGEAVLMQYTGLHDKNGKEIYEGDIVCDQNFKFRKHVVSWDTTDGTRGHDLFYIGFSLVYRPEECEVIGNIYENPELIK